MGGWRKKKDPTIIPDSGRRLAHSPPSCPPSVHESLRISNTYQITPEVRRNTSEPSSNSYTCVPWIRSNLGRREEDVALRGPLERIQLAGIIPCIPPSILRSPSQRERQERLSYQSHETHSTLVGTIGPPVINPSPAHYGPQFQENRVIEPLDDAYTLSRINTPIRWSMITGKVCCYRGAIYRRCSSQGKKLEELLLIYRSSYGRRSHRDCCSAFFQAFPLHNSLEMRANCAWQPHYDASALRSPSCVAHKFAHSHG